MSSRIVLWAVALLVILACITGVRATTLTYKMDPHERACFYADAKSAGEKIAFYFAVQSGGDFDVDFEVTGPSHEDILTGHKERQGDYVFTAKYAGEHSFCFSNRMSTFTEKLIDFDITLEHEQKIVSPVAHDLAGKEDHKKEIRPLEESVERLHDVVGGFGKHQKYFRTRENRNFDTVKSTRNRIAWYGGIETAMVIVTAVAQVWIIQTFFTESAKPRV
ncbi:hypothetical protein HKX48_009164 [Thoreauomyces humboldtii]|nr:hypothetical protein HKX48_009164 [Thoreauomyces humboldtii]